jgi:hypothetical protein
MVVCKQINLFRSGISQNSVKFSKGLNYSFSLSFVVELDGQKDYLYNLYKFQWCSAVVFNPRPTESFLVASNYFLQLIFNSKITASKYLFILSHDIIKRKY